MIIRLITSAALTVALAPAQCAFTSVEIAPFGAGCGEFSALAVGTNNAGCSLSFQTIAVGMANPIGRVLVLSTSATPQPMPALGSGCRLYPSPDVVLFDTNVVAPVTLPVPSTLPLPLTLFAQGFAAGLDPTTAALEFRVSRGFLVDIQ